TTLSSITLLTVVLAPSTLSTLSLHDALPIYPAYKAPIISSLVQTPQPLYKGSSGYVKCNLSQGNGTLNYQWSIVSPHSNFSISRSEEHTSELQSRENLVCSLLLEKKKQRLHQ